MIHITFTEQDRLLAGPFDDTHKCIMATALRRMGHQVASTRPQKAVVDGKEYGTSEWAGVAFLDALAMNVKTAPFYGPSVVGKSLVLTPADSVSHCFQ